MCVVELFFAHRLVALPSLDCRSTVVVVVEHLGLLCSLVWCSDCVRSCGLVSVAIVTALVV